MEGLVKNKKIILILIIGGVFIIAPTVLALETNWPTLPGRAPLTDQSKLPDLIQYLYEWGIALGGLAVFISLLIAGVQYLASLGNPTAMKEATDRIQSAVLGLVLLLSSWLILNTINPDLTSFQTGPLNLSNIGAKDIKFEIPDTEAKSCTKIVVNYSGGTLPPLVKGEREGNCYGVSVSGKSITSSVGWLNEKEDKTCMGSLQFFTSNNCSSDMIMSYPATSPNITIDQTVKSIKFF